VISEPEVSVMELTPEDKIIIWASDGLWEFMSNQEVRPRTPTDEDGHSLFLAGIASHGAKSLPLRGVFGR
jgi:hypothetical protein